jgi:hypothetical protein
LSSRKIYYSALTSICKADEVIPIYVVDLSNNQGGVIFHGLEATDIGKN